MTTNYNFVLLLFFTSIYISYNIKNSIQYYLTGTTSSPEFLLYKQYSITKFIIENWFCTGSSMILYYIINHELNLPKQTAIDEKVFGPKSLIQTRKYYYIGTIIFEFNLIQILIEYNFIFQFPHNVQFKIPA